MSTTQQHLTRLDVFEHKFCVMANTWADHPNIRALFVSASRCGDGLLWACLITYFAAIPATRQLALVLTCTGLINALIYRIFKQQTLRQRPCDAWPDIVALTPPLDRYSFPSGHTLHAMGFSLLIAHVLPVLGTILLGVAGLIALSRVVTGLHYPSDVLAAIAIAIVSSNTAIPFL